MPDSKITALTSISNSTDPANDPLVIVDLSDTSMAATGTTKKVTLNQLLGASGTATLASATITGDLTVRTNKLYVTATGVGCGMTPITPLSVSGAGGIILFRTTDPSAPVASPYLIAPVSTGFSSTSPVYGYWYQSSGIGNPAVDAVSVITASNERYRIAADGIATWSNVGGVANTAMTLNATGLGVGRSPSYRLQASSGTKTTTASLATVAGITTTDADDFGIYFRLKTDATGANRYAAITSFDNGSGNGARDLVLQDLGGNLGIGVTPAGTGGCLQLKSGITFPATQVASSDANTLDDYEEGSFTPTIEGQTTAGVGTYVNQVGRYTKIGNLVTVQIHLNWTAHTGTGSMLVSGLPFTSSGVANLVGSASIGYVDNLALSAGNVPLAYVLNANTRIQIVQTPTGGGSIALVPMDTAATIVITATYMV